MVPSGQRAQSLAFAKSELTPKRRVVGLSRLRTLFFLFCLGQMASCTTVPSQDSDMKTVFNDGKLEQLQIFTRIANDIKYFHPSEGVSGTDWDAFMATRMNEIVHSPKPFVEELRSIFKDVAPSVRIDNEGASSLATLSPEQKMAVWLQNGYTEVNGTARPSAYYRKLVFKKLSEIAPRDLQYSAKYGDVAVTIPLALPVDSDNRILPASSAFTDHISEEVLKSGYEDLYLCLSANAKIWGIFYEYYPYFRDVHFDWAGELPEVLASCNKSNVSDKIISLRKSLTKLQDNHIGLFPEGRYYPQAAVPVFFNLIEGKIVATYKSDEVTGVQIGDELLEVDGQSVWQVIDGFRSQSLRQDTQATDEIAMAMILRRDKNKVVHMSLKSGTNGTVYSIDLAATELATPFYWTARRAYAFGGEPVSKKLSSQIYYLNLAKLRKGDVAEQLKAASTAQAVVLDLRSYPADFEAWREFFAHLTDKPVRPLPMYFHLQKAPGQKETELQQIPQSIEPIAPRLKVPMVVLSSRFTVSQGEQALGFLQSIGIPIVGEITYGANGDIVNADILGGAKAEHGLDLTFTGMEIRKADNSRFAGIGIIPDLKVERTVKGFITGRDEVLEFAKAQLEKQLQPASNY